MARIRRRFLIEYTPDVSFFLCRICRTHIALDKDIVYICPLDSGAFFRNVVNVQVCGCPFRLGIDDYIVTDVFCSRCGVFLGLKLGYPIDGFRGGRFIMFFEVLLEWDGEYMLYADTNEPVEDLNDPVAEDANEPAVAEDANEPVAEDPNQPVAEDPNQPVAEDPKEPVEDPNEPVADANEPVAEDANEPLADANEQAASANEPVAG